MSALRILTCGLVVVVIAIAQAPRGVSAAANNDADAGTWQMIVLTSPTQFSVALPAQVTSADYQAELTAIKTAQAHMTTAERKAVDY